MSLTLYVDGDRFRTHLRTTLARHPDLAPVCKGNGYGLGLPRLAQLSTWLGVDTIAVGTYDELPKVTEEFGGSLLVLTPWRPFSTPVPDQVSGRVIHTVSRVQDLTELLAAQPDARIVLERTTSMRRHGLSAHDLRASAALLAEHRGGARIEGVAFHLPMAGASHLSEVRRLMNDVVAAAVETRTIWVSHLTDGEMASLAGDWPEFTFRPRVGTGLWLGDRGALTVRATVLDVHPVERGDVFGYRGRSAPKAGTVLVVSGGTAHGIGLEAPTGSSSLKDRAATFARGGLDAAGFVRSPYSIGGKQRLFAEPPHMQASMLFVPHGTAVPAIGAEVDVRVRYTATAFDRILIS